MKLWVIGASAVRVDGSEVPFAVGYGFAESADEASEKAWKFARETYPEPDGWGQHHIVVGAVCNKDIGRIVASAGSTLEFE